MNPSESQVLPAGHFALVGASSQDTGKMKRFGSGYEKSSAQFIILPSIP